MTSPPLHHQLAFRLQVFLLVGCLPLGNGAIAQSPLLVVNLPNDELPDEILDNTQINVFEGASLPITATRYDNPSGRSTIPGTLGFDALGRTIEVNLLGGQIEFASRWEAGITVNAYSGVIGALTNPVHGGILNLRGAQFSVGFSVSDGSTLSVSHSNGEFAPTPNSIHDFGEWDDSRVGVQAGGAGPDSQFEGGIIELIGQEFSLDGQMLTGLPYGVPIEIESRDVELAGILADGSDFRFQLSTDSAEQYFVTDYFAASSTILVRRVPEPMSLCLAIAASTVFGLKRRLR